MFRVVVEGLGVMSGLDLQVALVGPPLSCPHNETDNTLVTTADLIINCDCD